LIVFTHTLSLGCPTRKAQVSSKSVGKPKSVNNSLELVPDELSAKNTKAIPLIDPQSRVAEFAKGLPNAKSDVLPILLNPKFELGEPSARYLPADEPSQTSVS